MTRWARAGNSSAALPNRKVCSATPWEELQRQQRRGASGEGATNKRKAPESQSTSKGGANNTWKKKKKDVYVNQDVNGFGQFQAEQRGAEIPWKDERREERRLKRQTHKKDRMICFHCRKPGHGMADCSESLRCQESGTGICFRCGSTEHEINKCRAKVDPALGEFPFAKCFICGEMGHLSRSCPDNPKGLYAQGGSCRICGSVEHFQRDCPEQQHSAQVTVKRWSKGMSADYEEIPVTPKVQKTKVVKTPKIVTF